MADAWEKQGRDAGTAHWSWCVHEITWSSNWLEEAGTVLHAQSLLLLLFPPEDPVSLVFLTL